MLKKDTPMKTTLITIAGLLLALGGPAQAKGHNFKAYLKGGNEVPPVETDTRGRARFRFNRDLTYLNFSLTVRAGVGILGASGAHLHCAEKGQNGPVIATLAGAVEPGFDGWLVVKAGLTDANVIETDCGTSLADLAEAMLEGGAYVNVHSLANPGGEVRGQVKGNAGKGTEDPDP
jgi:hypothetical protein